MWLGQLQEEEPKILSICFIHYARSRPSNRPPNTSRDRSQRSLSFYSIGANFCALATPRWSEKCAFTARCKTGKVHASRLCQMLLAVLKEVDRSEEHIKISRPIRGFVCRWSDHRATAIVPFWVQYKIRNVYIAYIFY